MKISEKEKQKVLEYLQKVQADYYKRAGRALGVDRIIDVDLSKVYPLDYCDRFNTGGYKLLVTLKEGTGFVFFGELMYQKYYLRVTTRNISHYASCYTEAPYEQVQLMVPFMAAWEEDNYPPLAIEDEGKIILQRIYTYLKHKWQTPIATDIEIEQTSSDELPF